MPFRNLSPTKRGVFDSAYTRLSRKASRTIMKAGSAPDCGLTLNYKNEALHCHSLLSGRRLHDQRRISILRLPIPLVGGAKFKPLKEKVEAQKRLLGGFER